MLNINNVRIIFIGTSYFSVLSIEKLLKIKYNIVGIVSITERFSVRKKKSFVESAVKKYSKLHALPILQSADLRYSLFLETLQKWHAEIIIIVSFRMIPKIIWELPIFRSFNLHASLLPNYRGADPIKWVIMNGENETGITTFQVGEKIDMGRIFLQNKIYIKKKENAGSLSIRLSELGANLIFNTIKCIIYNCIIPKKQTTKFKFKIAPKLLRLLFEINWKDTIKYIYNKIRGLSPLPGAWFKLENNIFKIYRVYFKYEQHFKNVGNIEQNKIVVKEGYILILEYQLEGKLPVLEKDFKIRRDSLLG